MDNSINESSHAVGRAILAGRNLAFSGYTSRVAELFEHWNQGQRQDMVTQGLRQPSCWAEGVREPVTVTLCPKSGTGAAAGPADAQLQVGWLCTVVHCGPCADHTNCPERHLCRLRSLDTTATHAANRSRHTCMQEQQRCYSG